MYYINNSEHILNAIFIRSIGYRNINVYRNTKVLCKIVNVVYKFMSNELRLLKVYVSKISVLKYQLVNVVKLILWEI